jgi:hypothetical protein
MIGIFILAVVVVAIVAAVGYGLISEIRTSEIVSMAGRNAPRMDAAVSALAASARALSGGQPVVPAPAADASGRAILPNWVSTDGATPWGVSYGYCPYAVPDRPDLQSTTAQAVGGQGERRDISTVPLSAEGADRPYVVVGQRAPRPDDDAGAPAVAAFLLSPVPGASDVPDCGSVVWRGGRYRIAGSVPGIVSVLTPERLRDAATGLGAVLRWASPTGTGDGRSKGSAAPLSTILAEWRSTRPTRAVVRLVGVGPHLVGADDLSMTARGGGREGSLELVSDQSDRAALAGPSAGGRLQIGVDLSITGVAFANALGVAVRPGGRLNATGSVLKHLLLDGGDAVLGVGSSIVLDPSLDPGAAARVRGGTLLVEEKPGERKSVSAGSGRPAFVLQGGTLVVNGADVAADEASDWAVVENGGRISAIPRYAGSTVVAPSVTVGGAPAVEILSRTSFGVAGATLDDRGADVGMTLVTETCDGPTCSATCPTDRRVVSGDCEAPGPGWALSSFGTGGGATTWSCAWISVSQSQQQSQSSTARASCGRLR